MTIKDRLRATVNYGFFSNNFKTQRAIKLTIPMVLAPDFHNKLVLSIILFIFINL